MTRGVLYVVWGSAVEARLQSSIASVRRYHHDMPIHIQRLPPDDAGKRNLLKKCPMQDYSPFDETLYLDADTTVLGKLDFGFDQARKHGVALSICECPWARRYRNAPFRPDAVEYNTGVIFWSKQKAAPLFDEWKRLGPLVDSTVDFMRNGQLCRDPCSDQAAFCMAVENISFNPFVLPLNWNFRQLFHTSFFGPIRIWHDYSEPPQAVLNCNAAYDDPRMLIDYHRFIKHGQ